MRFITALLVAVVASGLAACGGSEKEKVEDTVKAFSEALANGDGEGACSQLSDEGANRLIEFASQRFAVLASADCTEIVDQLSGALGAAERAVLLDAEVSETQIDGDEATAKIEGAIVIPVLIRSDDDWLIDSAFAGS